MSMEVVSARSALLSNYEVLTLLRELESDQRARQKTALRVKKEEEERVNALATSGESAQQSVLPQLHVLQEEVSENLRTVEFEAIQYLTAEYQPLHKQTEASVQHLVRELAPYDFTKAEKLQIVNLAPTEAVELYVIVEEIEDRLGDRMEEVLEVVRDSVGGSASVTPAPAAPTLSAAFEFGGVGEGYEEHRPGWEDDGMGEGPEFDDLGDGAGVEGDLEMDDD